MEEEDFPRGPGPPTAKIHSRSTDPPQAKRRKRSHHQPEVTLF